jgi:hypothetical protein
MSGKEWAFFLTMMSLAILVTLAIPVVRDVVKGIFGLLLVPAFLEMLKTLTGYLIWIAKTVVVSHWVLLKNLVLPRSFIYRTLEKEEEGVVKK